MWNGARAGFGAVVGMSVSVVGGLVSGVNAGNIDPVLRDVMSTAQPDEVISALFYLEDQLDARALDAAMVADGARRRARHAVVVDNLRGLAQATQPIFLDAIERAQGTGVVERTQPFHLVNAVRVDADAATITMLAAHPEVNHVYWNHPVELIAPVATHLPPPEAATGIELGIEAINAPEVWALGITGSGVLVANVDTGVDGRHPTLASRWAGILPRYENHPQYAWFDPYLGQNDFPYDGDELDGHGTHTMGTLCGGAPGDAIGVAPGAHWIAAGAVDRGGSIAETIADILLALEWIVDPDGDSDTVWDVPRICSNSWGVHEHIGVPACDDLFWSFIDNIEATGCITVWAAGNEGALGLRRPADRATTSYNAFAVGAVSAQVGGTPVTSFSSRGPSLCTEDGSAAVKPEISAPGDNIRSAAPGGGYDSKAGTSMATPHVAGTLALVLQANPGLSVDQAKNILLITADDLGLSGDDNSTGHGLVDAYAAVQDALSTVALTFEILGSLPEHIDPAGGTVVRVSVSGQADQPAPNTGVLHYSDGGPYVSIPMIEVTENVYQVAFPAFPCETTVSYYFTAETTIGDVAYSPFNAPDEVYTGLAVTDQVIAVDDNMETDAGWTVENIDLGDGAWERGVPAGSGDRGDPTSDFDGSGQCWVTRNLDGNSDVDGGPTILTSPILDASVLPSAVLGYARWFSNDDFDSDRLVVEVTSDGVDWVLLEEVSNIGGWQYAEFHLADFITPSSTVQVRFSVADVPNDSITEAGIDALRLTSFLCVIPVTGDVDDDGIVCFSDLITLLGQWGTCVACSADLDANGEVGFVDLAIVLSNWDCGR